MGKQGYSCLDCHYPAHRDCYTLVPSNCSKKPNVFSKGFTKVNRTNSHPRLVSISQHESMLMRNPRLSPDPSDLTRMVRARPYTLELRFEKVSFKPELNHGGKDPALLRVFSEGDELPQDSDVFKQWAGEKTFKFEVGSTIGILCSLYVQQSKTMEIEVAQYVVEGYVGSIELFSRKAQQFADDRGSFELSLTIYHTELFRAIEDNKVEEVRKLLNQDNEVIALLNGTDSYGWTALHVAAKYAVNDPSILSMLLDHPNVDASVLTFETSHSPVHFLQAQFDEETFRKILAKFVAKGCPLNKKNGRGETPLVAAVARRNLPVIRGLLKSGQDVGLNQKDERGNTCLHYAALVDDYQLFRLLQENGADIEVQNNYEKTPLDIANASNSLEMKQFCARGGFRKVSASTQFLSDLKQENSMAIINENELTFEKILASGAFGDVWKGTYKDQEVAIKVLKGSSTNYSKQEIQEFKDEILVNGRVDSPYVVHYFGIVLDPLYFVMQFCHNGSLYDCLKNDPIRIDWYTVFHFIQQSIKAVQSLHNSNPQILHRDIKSKNFMVNKNWMLKIGDFGLSRQVIPKNEEQLKKKEGSPHYMAPEVYEGKGATTKSDVYSLGIVFWELVNTCMVGAYSIPYAEFQFKNEFAMTNSVMRKGTRPTIPQRTPGAVAQLISICWENNANLRPTTDNLLRLTSQTRTEWETNNGLWESKRYKGVLTAQQTKALSSKPLVARVTLVKGIDFKQSAEQCAPMVTFSIKGNEFHSATAKFELQGEANEQEVFLWGETHQIPIPPSDSYENTTISLLVTNATTKKDIGEAELRISSYINHFGEMSEEYLPICHRSVLTSSKSVNPVTVSRTATLLRPTRQAGSIHLQIVVDYQTQ